MNPHPRLTLTLPAINSARLAVFTVAGTSKADAVAALVRGDDIPAARVHAGRVLWLVDGPPRRRPLDWPDAHRRRSPAHAAAELAALARVCATAPTGGGSPTPPRSSSR